MSGKIFLINNDGDLVGMQESTYDSEDILQSLLEDYPDLLAGDQINQNEPRRWMLISREMEVSSEDVENRWSIDHLFLDQDGIPTLVEVKRSSDTRIRREVVGQMLDYAANAVVHWPIEKIRAKYETYCTENEVDADEKLIELIGEELEIEDFWQKVKTNLQARKIRMVFVADLIPSELKRVVEFLNEQMDPAEVIAVEIKQYVGESVKTLVPRVIGQTQSAENRKASGIKKSKLDKDSFIAALDENGRAVFEDILLFAEKNNLVLHWGTAGFSMNADINGKHTAILFGYSPLAWFGQSMSPGLSDISKKIVNAETLVADYKKGLSELKLFKETPKGMTWKINEQISEQNKDKLLKILSEVVNKILELETNQS